MAKKSKYVLAFWNGKEFMCESDDPRLENTPYHIVTGKFVKDKVGLSDKSGKKVLGTYHCDSGEKYTVLTSRELEKM